jgi:hypothetical protein
MHWLTIDEEDVLLEISSAYPHADHEDVSPYTHPDDVCDRLVARGLARETPCPTDPDAIHMEITDTGRLLLRLAGAVRE